MEIQATPFPGKSQTLKSRTNRNITEARKINAKEPPINRQRRVFGTIRNPNVTTKTVPEKPMIKPSIGVSQKQRKSAQTSSSVSNLPSEAAAKKSSSISNLPSEAAAKKSPSINNLPSKAAAKKSPSINNLPSEAVAKKSSSTNNLTCEAAAKKSPTINNTPSEALVKKSSSMNNLPSEAAAKNSPSINNLSSDAAARKSPSINNLPSEAVAKKSPEKNKARPKKKSVCFQENVVENSAKALQEGDITGLRTPVRSPSLIKARDSGTPYHSAEICSKCRFDKLETSSYWLAQIKLAESVGKHFVSAAFFRLAFESNAEPTRSLSVELKQYLARHQHLSAETEWRGVSISYGLIKDVSIAEGLDSTLGKICTGNSTCSVLDQEQKDLKQRQVEQLENTS
ncbi:hypothetical protein F0562_021804 [Nyssa sinensis]|uniref:Uncharacterized protein n=1 Tax=Nyssa sinensis TaxID=561372 RepID=A0A5J5BMC3_9ASTE|nr:hypothetical protein F0562_021804 [Nyssa sinensis]